MAKVKPSVPQQSQAQNQSRKGGGAPGTEMALPSPDAVAKRAFELFESRGGEHGHDVEDWRRAETELTADLSISRVVQKRHARQNVASDQDSAIEES